MQAYTVHAVYSDEQKAMGEKDALSPPQARCNAHCPPQMRLQGSPTVSNFVAPLNCAPVDAVLKHVTLSRQVLAARIQQSSDDH